MLIANNKTICLIGYDQSTVVQESRYFISQEFTNLIITMNPEDFLSLENKDQYQYIVAFTLDVKMRQLVIDTIEVLDLDCPIYVHDSVICYTKDLVSIIGKGTFIAPYSTICLEAKIGKYCIIETYCLISHYVTLLDNVILHSGTMIAGRTSIGKNTVFNFKSAALNALSICQDVEVGACSTITKNIEISGYYVGSPARKIGAHPSYA